MRVEAKANDAIEILRRDGADRSLRSPRNTTCLIEHAPLGIVSRTNVKADAREAKSGMPELFGKQMDVVTDRSSLRLKEGEEVAKSELLAALRIAGPAGKCWREIWPPILNSVVVTQSRLGRIANDLRKARVIDAPGWPSERKIIPEEDQLLRLS